MGLRRSDARRVFSVAAAAASICRTGLLAFAVAADVAGAHDDGLLTFTALSEPLLGPLKPGQVSNLDHPLPIPVGPIAIYGFSADVVEMKQRAQSDNDVVPTPLKDAYLHHHLVVADRNMEEVGPFLALAGPAFAAGSESRGTPIRFDPPFAFVTLEGEDHLAANVHVINTKGMSSEERGRCAECPCTSSDVDPTTKIITDEVAARNSNDEDGAWNGRCNAQLIEEDNDSCSRETYRGGLVCCEDGEYCLDEYDPEYAGYSSDGEFDAEETSTFYLRYEITYRPMGGGEGEVDAADVRALRVAACCDATGDESVGGNIEYDVPRLCYDESDGDENNGGSEGRGSDEDEEECVHELSAVQTLHGPWSVSSGIDFTTDVAAGIPGNLFEPREVDVVYVSGHLHNGGISIALLDDETGDVICESLPTYGTGGAEEGNESALYVEGMSTCTFDPPRRMRTDDKLRVVSRYDANRGRTGVMGLMYVAYADVRDPDDVGVDEERGGQEGEDDVKFAAGADSATSLYKAGSIVPQNATLLWVAYTALFFLGLAMAGAIMWWYQERAAAGMERYEQVPRRILV